MEKRVIIDTDAGIDDALSLMLALRSPELEIEAITTVSGNVEVDLSTRNVLLLIQELCPERQLIVARGESQPLVGPPIKASEVHGDDGIGNITELLDDSGARKYPEPHSEYAAEPAPELIVRLARENPDLLEIITLGPLTNIARAIEMDREAMLGIRGITIMGGAFREYGNTSLVAEYNIFVDPEAAAAVMELEVPKLIVPLDVTERAILPRSRLVSLLHDAPSRVLELAYDLADFYMDSHQEYCSLDGCYMHDPLTVAAVIDPDILVTVPTFVQVETKGQFTRGMTLAELRLTHLPRKTNARVAISGDCGRFIDFFLQRISMIHSRSSC